MFILDATTKKATANDRRQQRSRNESRQREGGREKFISLCNRIQSQTQFPQPLLITVARSGGWREGEATSEAVHRSLPN